MTLCHPSAVHWVRTVHTGGWAQPGPGLSSTSDDLQEPQRCVNVHSLNPSDNSFLGTGVQSVDLDLRFSSCRRAGTR
ncbi:hypothetical protein EYF80_041972 [Liparis tanakae]|uniref:Uncharacterized protein n=1 Tax=Liparis tanakae TaxID=230148 RepID=A0A4Z2G2T5_9TELE|nr:hypothetical protein EYF80_041972 [Liparis tanakae]